MSLRIGHINGHRKYPYVYFIIKEEYLYIGETQNFPTKRLSQHLEPEGTFSMNLGRYDWDAYNMDYEITYFCFPCKKIYNQCTEAEYKKVSQFLEHYLHTLFIINGNKIKKELITISDTSRSTPRNMYKYEWVKEYANEIFNAVSIEINNLIEL